MLRRIVTPHVVGTLALAISAFLVTHLSFRPVEHRFALRGVRDGVSVDLPAQEPQHLEFELSVQASGDTESGVVVQINGTPIARVAPATRYVFQRMRVQIPAAAVQVGPNRLDFDTYGDAGARFELRGRLHNYFGINPRFPRAFVVSDEAARRRWSKLGIATGTARFIGFGTASLVVVLLFSRILTLLGGRVGAAAMLAPSLPTWGVLTYSLATPLQVWLSVDALLVAVLIPCALVWAGLWARAHRAHVAKLALAAAFTVVGTEILFRAYNRLSPSFVFYSDAHDRFRPQPGARFFDTVLNSRGFNDVEYPITKPAGVRRIIAIGDSFTAGVVPYAANYLTLLEQNLGRQSPTEVINMGIPGTEPKDYLSILVAEGLAFAPDEVLVGFYIGNDFEATARRPYEYSYVATFVNALWQLRFVETASDAGLSETFAEYDDERPGFARERFLEIEADRARIFMTSNSDFPNEVSRAAGYLREMRMVAERAGARLTVVLMPAEVQIDPALQDDIVRTRQSHRDEFDFTRPNRLLAAALTEAEVPFVDLLPAFEKEAGTIRLYKPQDTHWNVAGNRLAATAIGSYLQQATGAR